MFEGDMRLCDNKNNKNKVLANPNKLRFINKLSNVLRETLFETPMLLTMLLVQTLN